MINRAPPGWRHNPSSFSRRARLASIAAIAALLVTRLEAPSQALGSSSAFVLLVCGALSLIGGSHRWASSPYLVALLAVLAIPVSLANTALIVWAHVEAAKVDPLELGFVGLTALLAGAVIDEILASAQMIRRHSDHGHSVWRLFFGLHSERRNGRAVTLDDVLKHEGERP